MFDIKKITAASAAMLMLTGCTFGASIDTLMAPPKLSIEQEQIYSALTDATGESISLKYPKSGKYLSAFIVEDIDGDGGREALVFYEKKSLAAPENTLRINILDSENGSWHSVYDTPADGSEIERVMISRLGENQRMNLIIGSSLINRSEKMVTIYSYSGGELERTFSESYAFIDVTDLDRDDETEFLLLKGTSNDNPASAEAYKLDKSGKYHRYHVELSSGFTEFDSVSYGPLTDDLTGLYIDAVASAGYIQTDVVYMTKGGMTKAFATPEASGATLRPSGFSSYDVDGDGTLEIPVRYVAPCYEDSAEGEKLWLTKWLTIDEKGHTKRKYNSYYSVGDGYAFIFPDKWRDKVTVKRDVVNDEIVFCAKTEDGIGRELLRIFCADDAASRDDRISAGYMLLSSKGESAFVAYISPDTSNSDGLSLTSAETAIGFINK